MKFWTIVVMHTIGLQVVAVTRSGDVLSYVAHLPFAMFQAPRLVWNPVVPSFEL